MSSGIRGDVTEIGPARLSAWRPRLLDDATASAAGLSTYDDLGSPSKTSISMRGFAVGPTVGLPNGVSVFLDGVRQNEPDAQEVNFDLLPLAFVRHVELLNGPASLLGPNGLAGAVNLISDHGSGPPHGDLEIEAGSFGDRSIELSSAAASDVGWRYFASAGGDRGGGWRAATTHSSSHVFANLGRATTVRGFNLQLSLGDSRAQTAGSLPESIYDRDPRVNFTAGDLEVVRLGQLALSGFSPLGHGQIGFTTYVRDSPANRFNANQPPDPNIRDLTRGATEGATIDWRRALSVFGRAVDTRVGVDGAFDQVHVRLYALPPTGATGSDSLTTDVESARTSLAAYGLTDMRLSRLTFSAGARYDVIRSPFTDRLDPNDTSTVQTFRRLAPRGGMSIDLGHGATVYASAATSFRAPALLELGCADPASACPLPFALGDDPPLRPVIASSLDVGAQALVGDILLRASAYRTQVRDEIFFISSPQALLAGYFANVPRTQRAGGELEIRSTGAGRLFWYGNYTRTRATFEAPASILSIRSSDDFAQSAYAGDNRVLPGDALPLVPRDLIKLGAAVDITSALNVGVDTRRVGRQWLRGDEANQTKPLDPYTVVDARANVRSGPWSVDVTVRNLLDTRAATFGTFNENRETGALERFLMPLEARSLRLQVGRSIGAAEPM